MWCAACRADVAAELSADNRRMLCARCQSELGTAAGAMDRTPSAVRSQDTERNARELLARWSTQHLLEPPISASTALVSSAGQADSRTMLSGLDSVSAKPARRFDSAHASVMPPVISQPEAPPRPAANPRSSRSTSRKTPSQENNASSSGRDASGTSAAPTSCESRCDGADGGAGTSRSAW